MKGLRKRVLKKLDSVARRAQAKQIRIVRRLMRELRYARNAYLT